MTKTASARTVRNLMMAAVLALSLSACDNGEPDYCEGHPNNSSVCAQSLSLSWEPGEPAAPSTSSPAVFRAEVILDPSQVTHP